MTFSTNSDMPLTMVRQCVILVGGQGTRLGSLTASTPKPLLPVDGRPFLELLLLEAARHGLTHIVLLAGYLANQFDRYEGIRRLAGRDVKITVIREDVPLGTGGALSMLRGAADEQFLLLNGDTWFGIDLRSFVSSGFSRAQSQVKIALRRVDDASRYGLVETSDGLVTRFAEKASSHRGGGTINAGVCLLHSRFLDRITHVPCSLEAELFTELSGQGLLEAVSADGFFIDIGVPSDYAAASGLLRRHRTRPAVFFDRDGVLNQDLGYTHRPEQLQWTPGAVQAVRKVNDSGFYCFVVTNQAGVAHGYFDEVKVDLFHTHMDEMLGRQGAHVDEFCYCPFHPQASLEAYRQDAFCRKPKPGMLLDLMERWPVDASRSIFIGDKDIDMEAAAAGNIRGYQYLGGNLSDFTARILDDKPTPD
jgi:D-glycero-D-manno-heptose 1,7-bisphosphate phosphatase